MMTRVLLYLWQLPQNIAGVLLLLVLGARKNEDNGITYYYSRHMKGGITLGQYIIIGTYNKGLVRHEYGHSIQSKILGPLYLLVVGIPSIIHAWKCDCTDHSYFDFWTEKWANNLGK